MENGYSPLHVEFSDIEVVCYWKWWIMVLKNESLTCDLLVKLVQTCDEFDKTICKIM